MENKEKKHFMNRSMEELLGGIFGERIGFFIDQILIMILLLSVLNAFVFFTVITAMLSMAFFGASASSVIGIMVGLGGLWINIKTLLKTYKALRTKFSASTSISGIIFTLAASGALISFAGVYLKTVY